MRVSFSIYTFIPLDGKFLSCRLSSLSVNDDKSDGEYTRFFIWRLAVMTAYTRQVLANSAPNAREKPSRSRKALTLKKPTWLLQTYAYWARLGITNYQAGKKRTPTQNHCWTASTHSLSTCALPDTSRVNVATVVYCVLWTVNLKHEKLQMWNGK